MSQFRRMRKKELLAWLRQHRLSLGQKLGLLQGQGTDPDTLVVEGEILDFLIYAEDLVEKQHTPEPPSLDYEIRV